MKHLSLTLLAIVFSIAGFATVFPFSPSSGGLCVGSTLYLTDSLSPGGTWSSSNIAVATVGTSGHLTGVGAGTAMITYTIGSSYVTGTFTVNPIPSPIGGGPTSFCAPGTATHTDATPGGTWSSSDTWIATVGAATGVVTGVHGGTVFIYYNVGGCSVNIMDTVNETYPTYIYGPTTVCVGSTINLSDSLGTGSGWNSADPSIATVSSTGVVTGVSAGTVVISLATTGVCGTVYSTTTITVGAVTAGTIYGPGTVTVGSTGYCSIYGGPGGGTWSINPTSVATIDASTGNITGVSAGTAIITYTAISCGTTVTATDNVTITSLDGISGNVNFSSTYYGNVKVYLIRFNPGTLILSAYDSVVNYCSGTSVYYQFTGLPTDSFRVKAAVPDSIGSGTGFIPTYHNSFFYWHDADVINHISGSSDINKNINMLTGTTTTGPGFIGGNVMTGANRGTSGSIPSVNLKMVAVNTTASTIAQIAYTNAAGDYSFSNLPYGTYTVFPDSLNFITTPLTSVTLNSSSPSFSSAAFTQHTLSKTITPGAVGINQVAPAVSSVSSFPNPTHGKVGIIWTVKADEKGTINVSDITGREVYTSTINLTEGSGMTSIDLLNLNNGLYVISIKSASLNYNNKIEIQH